MLDFEPKPVKLLFVIVDRGLNNKVTHLLNENEIEYHIAIPGKGTAPKTMQAYFGLGEKEKSIIIGVVEEERVAEILGKFKTELDFDQPNTGIAFTVRIGSLSSMLVLQYITGFLEQREDK